MVPRSESGSRSRHSAPPPHDLARIRETLLSVEQLFGWRPDVEWAGRHIPMTFNLHIGIDYSGRATPMSRTSALQVYGALQAEQPHRVLSPASTANNHKNWRRQEIADWLIVQAKQESTFIAGIDHGFSFPLSYFERYKLKSWEDFIEHFCRHWPTDGLDTRVDFFRDNVDRPSARSGKPTELRLTEKWTSSAKSVFQFDVQGSVAKSTHAGIPWLRRIREEVGDKVHFWPFDGWAVSGHKSVIAEVYPAIFRNRYPRAARTVDQQDAYCVARWLTEADQRGFLARYFQPLLTEDERSTADLEGWILGIL